MQLNTAVQRFLDVIEHDAEYSYREWDGKKWNWNEEVWKRNDPIYYKHWKCITGLLKDK